MAEMQHFGEDDPLRKSKWHRLLRCRMDVSQSAALCGSPSGPAIVQLIVPTCISWHHISMGMPNARFDPDPATQVKSFF